MSFEQSPISAVTPHIPIWAQNLTADCNEVRANVSARLGVTNSIIVSAVGDATIKAMHERVSELEQLARLEIERQPDEIDTDEAVAAFKSIAGEHTPISANIWQDEARSRALLNTTGYDMFAARGQERITAAIARSAMEIEIAARSKNQRLQAGVQASAATTAQQLAALASKDEIGRAHV